MALILFVEYHSAFRQAASYVMDQEPDLEVVAQAGSVAEGREKMADGGIDAAIVDIWVVRLPSASSLTQQELRGEYLVVGHPIHDCLEVARCCSHERSDPLRELLNGRAGELIGRYHELRDTPLGLFGVELFFVHEVLTHHLIVVFSLTPSGILCRVVGHKLSFLDTSLRSQRPR